MVFASRVRMYARFSSLSRMELSSSSRILSKSSSAGFCGHGRLRAAYGARCQKKREACNAEAWW